MAIQDAKSWLKSHRESRVRNLLGVTTRLRSASAEDLEPALLEAALLEALRTNNKAQLLEVVCRLRSGAADLKAALLEALRNNNETHLEDLLSMVKYSFLREESLTAAWRRARAQGLPLSEDVQGWAVGYMVDLRYYMSDWQDEVLEGMQHTDLDKVEHALSCLASVPLKRDTLRAARRKAKEEGLALSDDMETRLAELQTSYVPQRSEQPRLLEWQALWDLVDQLLRDIDDLLGVLEHDAEEADDAVALAMRSALAIRALKGSFHRSSKGEVPWDQIEFLLAMFVEARTVFDTLAFLVATAGTTRKHLLYFREKLQELKDKFRSRLDTAVAMKEMKVDPKRQRAHETTKAAADEKLASLLEDYALLRDWHSLIDILEALEAAIAALKLSCEAWKQWGWLALNRGLFLAGEKMKNSWTSANLSSRYVKLVELMCPEGILKILCKGIRDAQEHSAAGTNAEALTMSDLDSEEQRNKLAEELGRVLHTVSAMFVDVQTEIQFRNSAENVRHKDRVMCATRQSVGIAGTTNLIHAEVDKILKNANTSENDDKLEILNKPLSSQNVLKHDALRTFCRFNNGVSIYYVIFNCSEDMGDIARIQQLFTWKSAEGLSIFQEELKKSSCAVDGSGDPSSASRDRAVSALKHLKAIYPISDSILENLVADYVVQGGLQALASRWHKDKDDLAAPLLVPHEPVLFGRQLRNHLNHWDQIVNLCFPVRNELQRLWFRVVQGDASLGAEPRLRDLAEAAAANDEVIEVAKLKDAMFRAAREGDLPELQRVAGLGVDISSRDCRGRTLLHAAAQAGQVRVVDWLLQLGPSAVDPLAQDWEKRSALHDAATGEVAELLLAAGLVDPCQYGHSPLHTAGLSGRSEVLRALMPHYDLNGTDNAGNTPLHHAALGGHEDAVRVLLQAGARYEAVPDNTVTSLKAAAGSGSAATVRLLLLPPPPLLPQPSDDDCWRATADAGYHRHLEAFSALMAELQGRGARRDTQARLCVRDVAAGGSSPVALELLRHWPDAVRLVLDEDQSTALDIAARHGHADLVRTLLERGADPLHRVMLWTALQRAALGGSVEVIEALWEHKLLEQDAARSEELRRLWTGRGEWLLPLCVAAEEGHLAAVQRLVELGADKDAGCSFDPDWTPLCGAALRGRHEVVGWLLEQGARLYRPEDDCTPLRVAALCGNLGVVQLLVPSSPLSEEQQREQLGLLQHVGTDGHTALHCAVVSGSLAVVQHLLEREEQLLEPHYNDMVEQKKLAVWRDLTVYRRDGCGGTPLQWCVEWDAPAAVFRALLTHMEKPRVMELGGTDVLAVLNMVQEALDCVDKVHDVMTTRYGRGVRRERMKAELNESLRRLDAAARHHLS